MPTILTNGIQLPDKGSVDWYSSMQSNYNLIDTHLGNTDIHVTAEDKANWDSKQGSLSQAQLDAIAQVATNTNDIATLQTGKANTSHTHSSSDITDIEDYATKQYVNTSISGLVDNAPDALNTLNELSAALNDDSNFASTVATALGNKANSADLATVATSGDYDDLTDLPTYGITRFCSSAITDNSSVVFSAISSTNKIKVGDFLLDINGKMYQISAVDTANETVSVTTPLTQLAVDSDVVHKSGNETVGGEKTFSDLHIIGYGTQYKGSRNAYILPEFSAGYSGLAITTLSFAQTLKIGNFILDANNKPTLDTSKAYVQVATGESNNVNTCVLEPRNSTYSSLGTPSNKWNVINGLEPSSLSLPSGNLNDIIDISGYLTYLDGTDNTYVAPANGWITIKASTATGISCTIPNLWNDNRIRTSAGGLRMLFPILKGQTVYIAIYATILDMARFIPCQGNV